MLSPISKFMKFNNIIKLFRHNETSDKIIDIRYLESLVDNQSIDKIHKLQIFAYEIEAKNGKIDNSECCICLEDDDCVKLLTLSCGKKICDDCLTKLTINADKNKSNKS